MIKYAKLSVDSDDYELFKTKGYEEFIRHNPQAKGMILTERIVFKRMLHYYLDYKYGEG